MALDVDYTKLSLTEVRSGLQDVMRQTQATFGADDVRQLNTWATAEEKRTLRPGFRHGSS